MPTYYFRNTGSVVWGTSTNWSQSDGGPANGAVPTSSDDAILTSNSGNITVSGSNRVCRTLTCTGYTGLMTLTLNLTVSGSITLNGAMTLVPNGGTLLINASSTLTSNGCTVSVPFSCLTAGVTMSIADGWTFTNSLSITGTLASPISLVSNSPGVQRVFTLAQATQDIDFVRSTDINSSLGLTAWNYKGTISNCNNWILMPLKGVPTSGVF